MARSALSTDSLCFMRECSICYDEYNDPRMLPCLHTFCYNCLKQLARDKEPGEIMSCPLCRTEFTIPVEGIDGIQKNYFMENVITMWNFSESKQEIYAETEKSRNRQSNLKNTMPMNQLVNRFQNKFCTVHKHRTAEVYCSDCKLTICPKCYATSHKEHTCFSAKEIGEEFRVHLVDNLEMISNWSGVSKNEMQKADKRKHTILEMTSKCETEILRHAQHIKELVDQHANRLVQELTSNKTEKLKEIETEKEEIDRHFVMSESYRTYANEIVKKSSVEICQHFEELQKKADDLERCRVFFTECLHSNDVDSFHFTPSHFENIMKSTANVVGKFTFGSRLKETFEIQIQREKGGVVGMTVLDDKIYVVCNASRRIRAFSNHKPFREVSGEGIDISEIVSPGGMASNKRSRQIFISEWDTKYLLRIQMPQGKKSLGMLDGRIRGLSTTLSEEIVVIVIMSEENQEEFYSLEDRYSQEDRYSLAIYDMSDVSTLKYVHLSKDINQVWHAEQLTNKNFVISYDKKESPSVYLISEISADAKCIFRTLDLRSVETIQERDWRPIHFVIDGDNIYVCDYTGDRIFRLNRLFTDLELQASIAVYPMKEPTRICFSSEKQQLFVGKGKWTAYPASAYLSVFHTDIMSQVPMGDTKTHS